MNFGKKETYDYLVKKFPKGSTCLDVGACDGKWSNLLGDHFKMYAEAFKQNADNIQDKYEEVFNIEMQKFQYEWYDCIIMGDVIEHMTPKEGVRCYCICLSSLYRISNSCSIFLCPGRDVW